MIRYTPVSQLSIEGFEHPFDLALDKNNRWVKLAALIPWDELASVYSKKLESDKGRLSVEVRMVIGAIIVKHRLKLSDRETVETISENLYLQYFCGLKSFQSCKPFDATLFVDIRKRMGAAQFDDFNDLVIEKSEQLKPKRKRVMQEKQAQREDTAESQPSGQPSNDSSSLGQNSPNPSEQQSSNAAASEQHSSAEEPATKPETENAPANDAAPEETPAGKEIPKNKGTLKIDATVADQQILYPTDLGLLNHCREETERIIDILWEKLPDAEHQTKPRTYRIEARKRYLNIAKKKKKKQRVIRKAIGQQLRYLRRNIKSIEQLLDQYEGRLFPLKHRDLRIYWVLQHIYAQQLKMYETNTNTHPDRIVNIYQPYVRTIVRGKDKAKVEFGSKINISEYNGMSRIDTISWDAYNESADLIKQAERYKSLFGCYPELLLADRIYLNRANRAWLKSKGIRIVGLPLGRPPKEQLTPYQKQKQRKERNQRNLVEGKIGQAKNGYALNCIKARRKDTSESWISGIFFVMNLITLQKVAEASFLLFFKQLKALLSALDHKITRYSIPPYHVKAG